MDLFSGQQGNNTATLVGGVLGGFTVIILITLIAIIGVSDRNLLGISTCYALMYSSGTEVYMGWTFARRRIGMNMNAYIQYQNNNTQSR